MKPSPIQVSNLRLRLRTTKAFSPDLVDLLNDIDEMGEPAEQLVPDLIGMMKRGVYVPTIPLVHIISRLRSPELLSAALEQDEWPLSTFDRCELLQAGFEQFEEALRDKLFQIFENDAEPRRSAIVDALATRGSSAALDVLRVIEYRTSEKLASPRFETPYIDLAARKVFLEKVRSAINSVEGRSHLIGATENSTIRDSDAEEAEMAHVLFVDMVGYSKRSMKGQLELQKKFKGIVEGLQTVRRNNKDKKLIILPTGDGMALVFFVGVKPHVDAARELHRALAKDKGIQVRTGLHSGPVHRVTDINDFPNVSGTGINLAQRVMDCGDAGHILLSRTVATTLWELGDFEGTLDDLGVVEVKHGVPVHVFNLRGEGFGNADRPSRFVGTAIQQIPAEANAPRARIEASTGRSSSNERRLVEDFWRGFQIRIRNDKELSLNNPSFSANPSSKSSMSKTHQGLRLAAQIHPSKQSADVNLTGGRLQHTIMAKLHKRRATINQQFTKELEWRLNRDGESWVLIRRPFQVFRREEWEATYNWLDQNLKLFLTEFLPRIEAIRKRLEKG
jgi:class 3 adenylate cyclase